MFMARRVVQEWVSLGPRFLPFADAATQELPLPRLLRLSLFQISVGMAAVLLTGTLNRVMIVEMGVATWIVAVMVSLPLVFAPFRALMGHRSDTHKSAFGWRRVPFIWNGTLLQFGGLAIMPFSLLVMSDPYYDGYDWVGPAAAALAFLLVGAGMHMTQTAGLALATDLAPERARPRVVSLLYVMLLIGMLGGALVFGVLLTDFSPKRLIQVIQGAAVATVVLNGLALWKQELRRSQTVDKSAPRPPFREAWAQLRSDPRCFRLLLAVGLGTAGFAMQDVLLEPYGGEVLGLSVSATTLLTALLAGGTLAGLTLAARALSGGMDPHRLAAYGVLVGIFALSAVILSQPMTSPTLFRIGVTFIGFGGGLFAVGAMIAAMDLAEISDNGLALGAWGAVQATAMGVGLAAGGILRDLTTKAAESGALGTTLNDISTGYIMVYHVEIILLFATLVTIGPLVRYRRQNRTPSSFGLAELPG
jgi:BCD family chlorophyll transporter-like MFS transporter